MQRAYVKRSDCPTKLTWQEKYPTNYLYSSPPEIDHLRKALSDERRNAEARAPQPRTRQAGS
jgi:hypothetical protein